MRKILEIGGFVAAAVLIAFGVAAIVMGVNGRSTVLSSIKQEQIKGSPDMTPAAIAAEAKSAGLPASVKLPSCDVANTAVTNGDQARCFASYIRIHTLEATGGFTYAQMGRFTALPTAPKSALASGGGTDNAKFAVLDPQTKQPAANGARNLWVTSTALQTALNTSYMAQQLSFFGIVVGVALLLAGFGFGILAVAGALRNPETALTFLRKRAAKTGGSPLPAR